MRQIVYDYKDDKTSRIKFSGLTTFRTNNQIERPLKRVTSLARQLYI